jgi:voltage-gated potassium channel Kch
VALLVAVLVLYFVLPVENDSSMVRLISNIVIVLGCLAVAIAVIYRQFVRLAKGEALSMTGLQLLVVFEAVLVLFALTYFGFSHRPGEMSGLKTRVDALYFSATTMTTVGYGDIHAAGQLARVVTTIQLVFDIVFIAAFARLLTDAARDARLRAERLDEHDREDRRIGRRIRERRARRLARKDGTAPSTGPATGPVERGSVEPGD